MTTTPPQDFALIESIISKFPGAAQEDARTLFQGWSAKIATHDLQLGLPTGSNAQNIAMPPQASIAVSGANAAFTVTITNPALNPPAILWHEISYSTVKGFTSGVTTLEPTTATSVVLNLPNENFFFRVRSSYNKQVWNQYNLASNSAVSSGLVSSAATSEAANFNQTNLGVVTSVAVGSAVAVQVQGAGVALSSVPRLKGSAQSSLPGATIVGATPGATLYVGYHLQSGSYLVRPTLPGVMPDGVVPLGKLSTVTTAPPTLPVINPIVSGGYIIGYDVVDGGAGATEPYTLTFGSVGSGSGATAGAQTIVGGVLIAIAPGNPGNGAYSGGTTVTASGGIGPGTPGGGTAQGTTNGRLTT